jgi:hypothetical protein
MRVVERASRHENPGTAPIPGHDWEQRRPLPGRASFRRRVGSTGRGAPHGGMKAATAVEFAPRSSTWQPAASPERAAQPEAPRTRSRSWLLWRASERRYCPDNHCLSGVPRSATRSETRHPRGWSATSSKPWRSSLRLAFGGLARTTPQTSASSSHRPASRRALGRRPQDGLPPR